MELNEEMRQKMQGFFGYNVVDRRSDCLVRDKDHPINSGIN